MQPQVISTNAKIMSFFVSVVLLSFLTISIAAAAPLDEKSGTWVSKQYKITGDWSIEQRGDQQVITFSDRFKTKKGPDLKIFLSKRSIQDVTGANASSDAVFVSALKNNKGEQEYVIPVGIDVNDFESLLIHCEAYSVLWGGADL